MPHRSSHRSSHRAHPRPRSAPDAVPAVSYLDPDEAREGRRLRLALATAAAFHLVLLLLPVPASRATPPEPEEKKPLLVVQQVRFKPPVPPPVEPPPSPRARKVPIPDPTPEEPEPLRPLADLEPVVPDLPAFDPVVEIPDGPPPPPEADEPFEIGGDVTRPRAIDTPSPAYTELARKARIEGKVLLRLVLDRDGRVTELQVLEGLPMGLTGSAVEAVSTWRYEPATLGDRPVPVYMNVTVHFSLD